MHLAPLIQDLAVILGVATIVTYAFKAMNQPVVLGYIAAGIIVGPYTPSVLSVVDTESVQVWSELGVILLMFSLGLEFSFRKLLKLGFSAGFTGVFQVVFMVLGGYYLAKSFGWSHIDGVFLGCMIAISSTTIIIKALEELNLKSRKFAELTFGLLIVEDLAAILMLVALTNFITKSMVEPSEMLFSAVKLFFVVSIWIIFGIFLVPRWVVKVAKRGNDEMLTIAALSLCLGLVSLAAYFEYSVALGAFVMGSILSETRQVKRIEELMMPLRDVFGAIFFVSVGMMLNPYAMLDNFGYVLLITLLIIVGKIFFVGVGCLATGQSISTSVMTSFSVAQIGEFSFIIAALGQSLGVIREDMYPVIVAASLITTFTTPYLIGFSVPLAQRCETRLPPQFYRMLASYQAMILKQSPTTAEKKAFSAKIARFSIHAVVVLALFILSATYLTNWFGGIWMHGDAPRLLSWLTAMVAASPSIWAMLHVFKASRKTADIAVQVPKDRRNFDPALVGSWSITFVFLVVLSAEFFSGWISLAMFLSGFLVVAFIFRSRVQKMSHRIEKQFMAGLEPGTGHAPALHPRTSAVEKLLPWDAHLVPVQVPVDSVLVGKTLNELRLREQYGVNLIAIQRGSLQILAPGANERIYPMDELQFFASDEEIQSFRQMISHAQAEHVIPEPSHFVLRQLLVRPGSPLAHRALRESGIFAKYKCIVVGIQRGTERIKNPKSDTLVMPEDVLWIMGAESEVQLLIDDLVA